VKRAVCLLVLVAACRAAPSAPPATLPTNVRLDDPSTGAFVPAERYRGHVVVLAFWAGWCAACKASIPQLDRLVAGYGPQGLVVVGVNAGDSPDDAQMYRTRFGITYPIALDRELELSDRVGASSLPALVVVDRDGTIVHRAREVDRDTLAVIRRLLRSAGPAADATRNSGVAMPGS
jgi:thiol-disulfide isomerase/thioredoxin